ncbi:hypothetical protein FGO68_gene4068 [Halteria grandinella]|uniref:Uncharacterized protein n=1 Tax=Halteria grandinella TaxID=5974 RepID=A0A8J8SXH9_HALGN|nr:hypothetical protein FGO68_gene4068 [Halteria grandinella]
MNGSCLTPNICCKNVLRWNQYQDLSKRLDLSLLQKNPNYTYHYEGNKKAKQRFSIPNSESIIINLNYTYNAISD